MRKESQWEGVGKRKKLLFVQERRKLQHYQRDHESLLVFTQALPVPAEIDEGMGDPVAWADDLKEVEVNERMRLLWVHEFFEV